MAQRIFWGACYRPCDGGRSSEDEFRTGPEDRHPVNPESFTETPNFYELTSSYATRPTARASSHRTMLLKESSSPVEFSVSQFPSAFDGKMKSRENPLSQMLLPRETRNHGDRAVESSMALGKSFYSSGGDSKQTHSSSFFFSPSAHDFYRNDVWHMEPSCRHKKLRHSNLSPTYENEILSSRTSTRSNNRHDSQSYSPRDPKSRLKTRIPNFPLGPLDEDHPAALTPQVTDTTQADNGDGSGGSDGDDEDEDHGGSHGHDDSGGHHGHECCNPTWKLVAEEPENSPWHRGGCDVFGRRSEDGISEGQKLRTEGKKLRTEGQELRTEGQELRTEGQEQPRDNQELPTENQKLLRENQELRTENQELQTEEGQQRTRSNARRKKDKAQRTEVQELWTEEKQQRTRSNARRRENKAQRTDGQELRTENQMLQTEEGQWRTRSNARRRENETQRTDGQELRTENQGLGTVEEQWRTRSNARRKEDEAQRTDGQELRTEEAQQRRRSNARWRENKAQRTDGQELPTENQGLRTEEGQWRTRSNARRRENETQRTDGQELRTENQVLRTEEGLWRIRSNARRREDKAQRAEGQEVRTEEAQQRTRSNARRRENKAQRTDYHELRTENQMLQTEEGQQKTRNNAKRRDDKQWTDGQELRTEEGRPRTKSNARRRRTENRVDTEQKERESNRGSTRGATKIRTRSPDRACGSRCASRKSSLRQNPLPAVAAEQVEQNHSRLVSTDYHLVIPCGQINVSQQGVPVCVGGVTPKETPSILPRHMATPRLTVTESEDEDALFLNSSFCTIGRFNRWDCSTTQYLQKTRRSVRSLSGSRDTLRITRYSKDMLLHRLVHPDNPRHGSDDDGNDSVMESNFDDGVVSWGSEIDSSADDEQLHGRDANKESGDSPKATSTLSTCCPLSLNFIPRRLHSSASLSILIGVSVRKRVYADVPDKLL